MLSINSRVCAIQTSHKTYIGMSSRNLITRVRENLNFKSLQDSAIKDHILSCGKCSNNRFNENNFIIIRKCKSEFCSKIHEALLIKKVKSKIKSTNVRKRSFIFIEYILIVIFFPFFFFDDIIIWNLICINLVSHSF